MTVNFTIPYKDLRFIKELNAGSTGKVFLAEWKGELVAVKVYLSQELTKDKQEEIRAEAEVMGGLKSGHVVQLRGVCLEKSHYCVVMEYMPQGNLYQLLQNKSQPLSLSQRYRLAADIAVGLSHLHEEGMLHRDLKSLNVFLYQTADGLRAKVGDFNTVKLAHKQGADSKEFVGTRLWADPKVVSDPSTYSKAADVYSLGLVLWELVSRELPTPEKTSLPLSEECSPAFAALIKDCCSVDPAKRPTITEVIERLKPLVQAEEAATSTMSTSESSDHKQKYKPESGPTLLPVVRRISPHSGHELKYSPMSGVMTSTTGLDAPSAKITEDAKLELKVKTDSQFAIETNVLASGVAFSPVELDGFNILKSETDSLPVEHEQVLVSGLVFSPEELGDGDDSILPPLIIVDDGEELVQNPTDHSDSVEDKTNPKPSVAELGFFSRRRLERTEERISVTYPQNLKKVSAVIDSKTPSTRELQKASSILASMSVVCTQKITKYPYDPARYPKERYISITDRYIATNKEVGQLMKKLSDKQEQLATKTFSPS